MSYLIIHSKGAINTQTKKDNEITFYITVNIDFICVFRECSIIRNNLIRAWVVRVLQVRTHEHHMIFSVDNVWFTSSLLANSQGSLVYIRHVCEYIKLHICLVILVFVGLPANDISRQVCLLSAAFSLREKHGPPLWETMGIWVIVVTSSFINASWRWMKFE